MFFMDLARCKGEKAKTSIPLVSGAPEGSPEFHQFMAGTAMIANVTSCPPPGHAEGLPHRVNLGSQWVIDYLGRTNAIAIEVPVLIVSDSTRFFHRGGSKTKDESTMTEVQEFVGRATQDLKWPRLPRAMP